MSYLLVMRSPRRLLRASFLIASLGCHAHQHKIAPLDPERLSQEEMLSEHFTNVYDAVVSLRAAWLNVRGTDSFRQPSQVWVYYDENRLGGVDEMRYVLANSVASLRHYHGVDAHLRGVAGHGNWGSQVTA